MQPIIALDIDGVLNADAFTEAHHIDALAEQLPKSPFIRGGGLQDLSTTVRLNPAHRQWLATLAQSAELVWATTWEDSANLHVGPLLGLPVLPVAASVSTGPPLKWQMSTGAWKADCLLEYAGDRPLVWIDDMAMNAARSWERFEIAPTLVLVPNEHEGMQQWHLEAAQSFLAHLDEETVEVTVDISTSALLGDVWWLRRLGVPAGVMSDDGESEVLQLPVGLAPAVAERMEYALTQPQTWPRSLDEAARNLNRLRAALT